MWQLIEEPNFVYFQFRYNNALFLHSTKIGEDIFIKNFSPVTLKQIHSEIIVDIDVKPGCEGDGLITRGNKPIGVKVADCLPVFIYSNEQIAILHCGWRSIIRGILKNIRALLKDYKYCLGAAIGSCCYEVKDDVASFFFHYQSALKKKNKRIFLDLKKVVIEELSAHNLIGDLQYCTSCHPEYFYSYRRGEKGRNYAVAQLWPK